MGGVVKAVGKVVGAVASIAAVIPGPWQPVAAIVAVGAGLAVGITQAIEGTPDIPQSETQLGRLNARLDTQAPRKIVLATTAMPADIRYYEGSGEDDEYVDYIVAVAAHRVRSIDEIWFEDALAWSAAGGVQGDYVGYLTAVTTRLEGTAANTIAINGGARWGDDDRLTGCAYLRLRIKRTGNSDEEQSPLVSGLPSRVTIVGEGMPMYDPRFDSTVGGDGPMRIDDQSTWGESSENQIIQSLNVLLGWRINGKLSVGGGLPAKYINLDSAMTAANICDEDIAMSGGGSQKRYRGAGAFSTDDAPMDIVSALLAGCAGDLLDSDGQLSFLIKTNTLATPAVTFDDHDVLSATSWDPMGGQTNVPNIIAGSYTDPSDNSLYQMVPYPSVKLPSEDGIDRTAPLDFATVEDPARAERLAKQTLQRKQYPGIFTAEYNLKAMAATVGSIVWQSYSPRGWIDKPFRVVKQKPSRSGRIALILREEHEDIYAWEAEDSASVQVAEPVRFDPRNAAPILLARKAATTAHWSKVVDDDPDDHPKPDDGADVTGENTSKDTQAVGGREAAEVLGSIDQAKADIDDLVDTYGSTASAAASADAAEGFKTAAEQAKENSIAAAGEAQAAREGSEQAREDAIANALEAGEKADSASGSANVATTKAGEASASEGRAANSAEDAEGFATSAAESRKVAASLARSRGLTPNADFSNGLDQWFDDTGNDPVSNAPALWSHQPTYQGRAEIMQLARSTQRYVHGAIVPIDTARKYRARIGIYSDGAGNTCYAGVIAYDKDGNILVANPGTHVYSVWAGSTVLPDDQWVDAESEPMTGEGTGSRYVFPVGTKFAAPMAILNYGGASNGLTSLDYLYVEDVTESVDAGASATAAAEHEATASAKATEAGEMATAAELDRAGAETARSQTETFRDQASVSADDAEQSAGTATQQAGLSAGSAAQSGDSADASAGSAGIASTKATEAEQHAAASQASEVSAKATAEASRLSIANTYPETLDASLLCAQPNGGAPASLVPVSDQYPAWVTDSGQSITVPAGVVYQIGGVGVVPLIDGVIYEFAAEVEAIDDGTENAGMGIVPYFRVLDASYAIASNSYRAGDIVTVVQGARGVARTRIGKNVAGAGVINVTDPAARFLRAMVLVGRKPGSTTTDATMVSKVWSLAGRNVTGEVKAAGSAAAAVSSAETADAAKTDAGNFAEASRQERIAAEAANDNAQGAASVSEGAAASADADASAVAADRELVATWRGQTEDARDEAESFAGISSDQAAVATAGATAAKASEEFTAKWSGAGETINGNSRFQLWPEGQASPTYWEPNSSAQVSRYTGYSGREGFKQSVYTDDQNCYVLNTHTNPGLKNISPGWYVISCDVEIVPAGGSTFSGAGLAAAMMDAAGNFLAYADPLVLSAEVPSPVQGKTYRLSKLVHLDDPATAAARLYFFTNYPAIIGTPGHTKTLGCTLSAIRKATDEEVAAGRVSDLEARVSITEGVVADQSGRLEAYLKFNAAAGGYESFVTVSADAEGGDIALVSPRVLIGNPDGSGEIVDVARFENGVARLNAALIRGLKVAPRADSDIFLEVMLKPLVFLAADGEVIEYDGGASFGALPDRIDVDLSGLPALPAGDSYVVRATAITDTQFTAQVRKTTGSTIITRNSGAGSNVGGVPGWRTDKPTADDAYNGYYQFSFNATLAYTGTSVVHVGLDPPDGYDKTVNTYEGDVTFYAYSGSSWVVIGTKHLRKTTEASSPPSTLPASFTVVMQSALDLPTGSAVFGIHAGTGATINYFEEVSYDTQTQSSTAALSGRVPFTVYPPNPD